MQKDDRAYKTAARFGIVAKCEKLEAELLKIPDVVDVVFSLDGAYDNFLPTFQLIFLLGYDIGAERDDYCDALQNIRDKTVQIAKKHGLAKTLDPIENHGNHFYFVFRCNEGWNTEERRKYFADLAN